MLLLEINNQKQWDAFIASQPCAQFTQSWAWGEFRISRGQAIKRLALTDASGAWQAAALFIHFPKPLVGGYWYAPRGPVVRDDLITSGQAADVISRFLDELKSQNLSHSLFWRIEPAVPSRSLSSLTRSHAYMPASTLLVDLSKSEEDLLKEMHEKTRYNIRVAERHGVTVRVAAGEEAINAFLRLNDETAKRDGFVSQPPAYIRATYDFLAPLGMARIRIAEMNGAPLAASFEVLFGDTATYLYGASSSTSRNTMAPFALHWDAIRAAKASGHQLYDLYGVNPADTSSPYFKKSWEGITRFKLGWGGERVDYVGTWELPRMKKMYRLFRVLSR